MGRHFEVRAAAMAASAKAKSAIYMRASKEIYAAAKSGVPDPESNLALRSAIEKYRKTCPRDVIDRAIEKAKGGDAVAYIPGRYEFFGPGGSFIIVDTLTDNVNRALVGVRTIVTKKGGKMGSVAYNFNYAAYIAFKGDEIILRVAEHTFRFCFLNGDTRVVRVDLQHVARVNAEVAADVLGDHNAPRLVDFTEIGVDHKIRFRSAFNIIILPDLG